MAIPSNPDRKATCREEARAILRRIPKAEAAAWSERIAGHLGPWLASRPGLARLAIFAALPGEPDLTSLHHQFPDCDWLYPLVGPDHTLSFHRVQDPGSLRCGQFGIREPDPARHPPVPLGEVQVLLCPGLAFGSDGTRLGRGGGYYDRLLAQLPPQVPRIGVAFSAQLRSDIPTEPHDVPMTHLGTESGVVPVNSPAGPA